MAGSTFLYSGWITNPEGTPLRLSQLRLHIMEVANQVAGGDYAIDGRSVMKKTLQEYLDKLYEREKFEAEQVGLFNGNRLGWTRGRPRL